MQCPLLFRVAAGLTGPILFVAACLPAGRPSGSRTLVVSELGSIHGGVPDRECDFSSQCGATPSCATYVASFFCSQYTEVAPEKDAGNQDCSKPSTKTCTDDSQGNNDCAIEYQCEDDPDAPTCRRGTTKVSFKRAPKVCQ